MRSPHQAVFAAALAAMLFPAQIARATQPAPAPPANRDEVDLGFTFTGPFFALRNGDKGVSGGVGATALAFVQFRPSFYGQVRVALTGAAIRVPDATWTPLGFTVGYFRDRRWHTRFLFFGIEAGGGALLSDARRPFVEIALTPIAVGWGSGWRVAERRETGYSPRNTWILGLRSSALFLDDGPANARSFRFGAVTFGVSITYVRQVRRPTNEQTKTARASGPRE